jgi:sRNA-binding carbon storage regulator CsrA
VAISPSVVRFGIEAPPQVDIVREELLQRPRPKPARPRK